MVGLEARNMVITHQDFEAELTNDGQNEKNKTFQKPRQNSLTRDIKYLYISIIIYLDRIIDGESDDLKCESQLSSSLQRVSFKSLSPTLLICNMEITVPILKGCYDY